MEIAIRTSGDCHILDLNGQLVLGSATMKLRAAVHEVVKNFQAKIVVNLRNVTYMDTPGLGELVGCYSHAKSLGSKLVLLHPRDRAMHLLNRTKLKSVFDIFHDEDLAVTDSKQNAVPV